ncbi:MAG: hypothetical protein JRI85_10890 [Deltaproteobacteria bacterium]|nr:hypothetical protein [Deltaproteobacteria bacterium]
MANKTSADHKDLTWLARFANILKDQRFYGKIELIYQDGRIVNCKKEESIKPD